MIEMFRPDSGWEAPPGPEWSTTPAVLRLRNGDEVTFSGTISVRAAAVATALAAHYGVPIPGVDIDPADVAAVGCS